MADDLKRAQKALLDKGKELARTDEGKRFLALMLATRQEVEPYVPEGYARDVTVEGAGKAAGIVNEARRIYNAMNDLNSEDAVKYANKGINKLLKNIDPETTIKLRDAVAGDKRIIEASRKIGPGVAGATFAGDKLDFSAIRNLKYNTDEYGGSVNPQTGTANIRASVGPIDATAYLDPRARYAQVGGQYDAGQVGLFDTKLRGSMDTEGNVQARAGFSADTSKITDYLLGKPFGKAKGGKVKKYAKGGHVKQYSNAPRKPRLK